MWTGIAALGIWCVLLFAAVPEDQAKILFAWRVALHTLLEEGSSTRFTLGTLLLLVPLSIGTSIVYFNSRLAASRYCVTAALVVIALMCLAATATRLWFPFAFLLATAAYFGFRHLQSIDRQMTP